MHALRSTYWIQTSIYKWHKESGNSEEYPWAEHMLHTKHTVEFVKTTAKILNHYNNVVRESVELKKNPSTVNRNNGQDILDTWLPMIKM